MVNHKAFKKLLLAGSFGPGAACQGNPARYTARMNRLFYQL
jgi:hypothetical protein